MIIRHLYIWPRSLERLMWTFGWPFLDLMIWGLTSTYFQKTIETSFSFITFLLGGIIFWTIFWRLQSEINVNFLDEAWNKNLINIFATPLTWQEFLVAMLLLGFLKLLLTILSLTLAAWWLYHFNFLIFGFYIPFLLLDLFLFAWTVGFFVNGLILRFGYSVQELAWGIAFIVHPFSCVYWPLSFLPGWAQKIALFFPSSYVFEEMRRILFTGSVNWSNLLISFILNIIYLLLALKFFHWMYEGAREHGRLVKLN